MQWGPTVLGFFQVLTKKILLASSSSSSLEATRSQSKDIIRKLSRFYLNSWNFLFPYPLLVFLSFVFLALFVFGILSPGLRHLVIQFFVHQDKAVLRIKSRWCKKSARDSLLAVRSGCPFSLLNFLWIRFFSKALMFECLVQ